MHVRLSDKELYALRGDNRASAKQKSKLLSERDGVLSVIGNPLPESVQVEIIQTHFDTADLPSLLQSFHTEGNRVREALQGGVPWQSPGIPVKEGQSGLTKKSEF